MNNMNARVFAPLMSVPILLSLIVCLSVYAPQSAYADVRLGDIVLDESVESRGLTVSQCPDISAEYAYVVDEYGTVYFERNATAEAQIASITKIMTAIVALENASLDLPIHVGSDAALIGESTAALKAGDELTLDQALTALLVSSGNDAAVAIADELGAVWAQNGETPIEAFAKKMNEKAAELGMWDSYFENPHGLDFDEYAGDLHSTAADVAIMSAYAMQNRVFRSIVCQSTATITVLRDDETTELELESTDVMLDYYEGACGIKTGYTELAGACFAGACNQQGYMLYAIVLDSTNESQRFADCQVLFDWVYEHTTSYKLVNSSKGYSMQVNGATKTVPLVAEVAHKGWVDATVPATVADANAACTVFDLNGNVSQEVTYYDLTEDVKQGDVVGAITFYQRNEPIYTLDLIACADQPAPNLFQGIGVWFDRLIRTITGAQKEATSTLYNETPLIINKTLA